MDVYGMFAPRCSHRPDTDTGKVVTVDPLTVSVKGGAAQPVIPARGFVPVENETVGLVRFGENWVAVCGYSQ